MADVSDAVQRQLALLRQSYADKLPDRVAEIEAAAAPLREAGAGGDAAARAVDTLQALSHKLTGSAGTFGFAIVSQTARRLERRCASVMRGAAPLTPAVQAEILDLLRELRRDVATPDAAAPDAAQAPAGAVAPAPASRPDGPGRLLYLGATDWTAELSAHLGDFSLRLDAVASGDAENQAKTTNVVAGVVDLDAPEAAIGTDDLLRRLSDAGLRLIGVSHDGSFARRLAAVRSGFAGFLVKPIEVAALVGVVDRLLEERERAPYRILVVDDDAALTGYVEAVLGGAGMITRAETDPFAVMDAIAAFSPELVLLDLNMPGCSGAELATVIRQQDSLSSVSIVFLSGETDPTKQIEAMHTGGDDFLPKTLRAEQLVSAVEARAKRFRRLRSMLVSDSLTGLLNHTATRHQIESEVARSRRENRPFCLVMIDIDHFKAVNDSYGHSVGDQVIRSLALLLKQRFRTSDPIGRLGGEEFGIVLTGAGRADASRIVEGLREKFAAMRFPVGDKELSVTFSAGIAQFPDYEDAAALGDAADRALYTAKAAGRNRVVFADETI